MALSFMIAAPSGRSGKTIVSIGLAGALTRRGLTVQPFKKGPDYIDPSWLSAASGRPCRNLDAFLMEEGVLLESFTRAAAEADVVLVEGNMGLYDGIDRDGKGSSAHLARLLKIPILLVVDTARMSRSVAAVIAGFQAFEPDTPIAGIILNNVSGLRHRAKVIDAVGRYCKIPVLGTIPRDADLGITERHLGLTPFNENASGASLVEPISEAMGRYLDINAILRMAGGTEKTNRPIQKQQKTQKEAAVRIGVIFDRVFNFYYPENFEALRSQGAELIFIDSLKDQTLPGIDALYIGGGFPELFLKELAANRGLMKNIARSIEDGLPVYAECAGLMYLSKGISSGGRLFPMAGAIPSAVEIGKKPEGHGYVEAEVVRENPLFSKGATLRGHEFHHSRLLDTAALTCAYRIKRGKGINGTVDGIVYKNLFASYTHLHALGTPEWAEALVRSASAYRKHLRNPSRSVSGGEGATKATKSAEFRVNHGLKDYGLRIRKRHRESRNAERRIRKEETVQ